MQKFQRAETLTEKVKNLKKGESLFVANSEHKIASTEAIVSYVNNKSESHEWEVTPGCIITRT